MRLALIVSFLLAGGACLLFFFSFERRKPSVKDILPVVVMVAVASAGRGGSGLFFHLLGPQTGSKSLTRLLP